MLANLKALKNICPPTFWVPFTKMCDLFSLSLPVLLQVLIWVSSGLNVKKTNKKTRRIKHELHLTRTKHWCTNNDTKSKKVSNLLRQTTRLKSKVFPAKQLWSHLCCHTDVWLLLGPSRTPAGEKWVTSLDNITWDIITNSFSSSIELTCRAWVSRALWSRTSSSLLVSVHEHILSVKHQTPYKPSSGIFPYFRTMPVITSNSPAQEPVMFSIPHGNTDDGSPQLRHADSSNTKRD